MLVEGEKRKDINVFSHSEECALLLIQVLNEIKEEEVRWGNFYLSLSDEISQLTRRIEVERLKEIISSLTTNQQIRMEYLLRSYPMNDSLRNIYAEIVPITKRD